MLTKEELKSCPFCGGEAKLTKGITYLDNYVTCCECFSRTKTYNTKESAIKSWNERNGWIPCKEKLPKEDGYCLVTVYETDTKRIVVKQRVFKNGNFHRSRYSSRIIAWQPLPKPYEEKENVD